MNMLIVKEKTCKWNLLPDPSFCEQNPDTILHLVWTVKFTLSLSFSLCRCVCNIDCSHISFNPVCASDSRSYDNPCQVKEVSCQKQERIEVKYLGHCKGQSQLSIYLL